MNILKAHRLNAGRPPGKDMKADRQEQSDRPMKSDPAHAEALRRDMEERLPSGARPVGTVRVDVNHIRQLTLSSVCWEGAGLRFPLKVDEPPSRGGDAEGPAPLSYFVLGAASCLLTQFAKISMLEELKVDSLAITARAHFDHKIEGAFTDIIYDVTIVGREEGDSIIGLSQKAEKLCFASNTLKKVVKLTTNVTYNGEKIISLA